MAKDNHVHAVVHLGIKRSTLMLFASIETSLRTDHWILHTVLAYNLFELVMPRKVCSKNFLGSVCIAMFINEVSLGIHTFQNDEYV